MLPEPDCRAADSIVLDRIEAAAPDSSALKALSAKLETYVKAIEGLPADEQAAECDFLISSCNEQETRQFVATWLYRHYYASKIMGVEAVAVHIVDKWFTSGNARPESDIELMNARIFADFNRASLVGMPAPGLTLKNRAGEDVELFGAERSGGRVLANFQMAQDTGAILGPIIVGLLIQQTGFRAGFLACGVVAGLAVVAWCFGRETLRKPSSVSAL